MRRDDIWVRKFWSTSEMASPCLLIFSITGLLSYCVYYIHTKHLKGFTTVFWLAPPELCLHGLFMHMRPCYIERICVYLCIDLREMVPSKFVCSNKWWEMEMERSRFEKGKMHIYISQLNLDKRISFILNFFFHLTKVTNLCPDDTNKMIYTTNLFI